MRLLCIIAIVTVIQGPAGARIPKFEPTEKQISEHKSEVFKIARDYIVRTFNLNPIAEGRFNAVRFNSTGVWGDFRCRIKSLESIGTSSGWVSSAGYEEEEIVWSVVMTYALVDPDAWKYRRLDASFNIRPKSPLGDLEPTGVFYEAEYSMISWL